MTNSNSRTTVQRLTEAHRASWEELYRDYSSPWQEGMPRERLAAVWAMVSAKNSQVHGLGAFDCLSGELLGFAHYILYPCTYSCKSVCYLQDLYVAPSHRRHGLAQSIISFLTEEGKRGGWRMVWWKTRPTNEPANTLYQRLAKESDWRSYEISLEE